MSIPRDDLRWRQLHEQLRRIARITRPDDLAPRFETPLHTIAFAGRVADSVENGSEDPSEDSNPVAVVSVPGPVDSVERGIPQLGRIPSRLERIALAREARDFDRRPVVLGDRTLEQTPEQEVVLNLRAEVEHLREDAEEHEAEVERERNERDDAYAEVKRLTAELSEAEVERDGLRTEVDKERKLRDSFEREVERLDMEVIPVLRDETDRLAAALAEAVKAHGAALERYEDDRRMLGADLAWHKAEMADARAELKELKLRLTDAMDDAEATSHRAYFAERERDEARAGTVTVSFESFDLSNGDVPVFKATRCLPVPEESELAFKSTIGVCIQPVEETRYICTFTVSVGTIRSVFDMLRHDNCWPATEEDANKLAMISASVKLEPGENLVRFKMAGRRPLGPSIDRWNSFGCKFVSCDELREFGEKT